MGGSLPSADAASQLAVRCEMSKIRVEKKTRKHAESTQGPRQQIVFNKDFGQHILKNPLVVNAIVDKVRSFGNRATFISQAS